MAARYNTAAIRSAPVPQTAVNDVPTHYSLWSAATDGNFLQSGPLSRRPSALQLGERIEVGIGELRMVKGAASGDLVAAIQVTNGGSGYTSAPTVSFSGSGGAAATAVVESGAVVRVDITNPGEEYSTAPTVTLTGGSGTGAAATAHLAGTETDEMAKLHLAGATAAAMHVQFHTGAPGAAGTANVVDGLGRTEQPAANWTAE